MGFGRKRTDRRNYGDNRYRKKMGLKKKIKLLGLVLAFIGLAILAINHDTGSQVFLVSIALVVIGMVLIAGKRILAPPPCNCCKCINCDSNHNHWTHDSHRI